MGGVLAMRGLSQSLIHITWWMVSFVHLCFQQHKLPNLGLEIPVLLAGSKIEK